ncbi:Wzz/FepE/Etk N-terminal domain-containing protein [Phyllobacterium sp. 0TCS1.6C]|uniref:GumC family protein n=1 Tax=unclassified Phyllobacterium TaxID=2638441 RepID=UPI002264F36D|nr:MULTISPECIES: Wzz/FepE/Etk N-terminal domain-containing protein [unclassified Phyllobacterium]MCX8282000.1 Wzz/FepE/Etk N-terminal domain-containing protein [Phyllobacterium sp. 0TCS1.6C]MCX8294463.1 Wzz/FepE/Etk N-terminal domain-containing protein [Phyllobacterium sp. 0TCS1.6A]
MSSGDNETAKRRSLLSFASEVEDQRETPGNEPRGEDNLDHYRRMRALRLAAETDAAPLPLPEIAPFPDFDPDADQQSAVDRMRADMAAIKAELNRRVDAAERQADHVPPPQFTPTEFQPLRGDEAPGWRPDADLEPRSEARAPTPPATPVYTSDPVYAPVQAPARPETDDWKPLIDPRIVINRVLRSKSLILATTIIGTLIGVGYAMTLPKLYSSTVEMLVDPRDLKIVEKEIASSQLPVDASLAIAESQLRLIQSSSVLTKVIDKAGLATDPEFNGDLREPGLLSAVRELFSSDSTPDATTQETLLLRNLYDHLNVERSTKNFIFNITVESRDPDKSAFIANTVSDVFREEQANIQSDTARQATEALTARLNDLRQGVEDAENAVQKFKADNDLVDVQGRLISDDEITRTNDELTAARNQTIRLKAQADSIRNASVEGVLGNTLPEEFRSGVIVALRSQYGALKQQADGLATKLGPRHPQLIQAQSQVSGIRTEIRNELRRIASSVQVELDRSTQQEQELAGRLAQLKARTASNNEEMIKLRELQREVTAKREVYEAFLLRAREMGELEGVSTANIRVISPARPALESSGGSRKLVAIAGLIGGLLAGLGLAMLLGMIESFRAGNRSDGDGPLGPAPDGSRGRNDAGATAEPGSRLGAAIRRAEANSSPRGDASMEADDAEAVAEFLYAYGDALFEARPHDNTNIETALEKIARLRKVLDEEKDRRTA